ncbi:MAG: oxidoreductase [Promethearchaeota archaeon]|jgi:2,4-dienoyl-CoA reductase-like NADH-dependent reductase (Old Yellow Enzyme family)
MVNKEDWDRIVNQQLELPNQVVVQNRIWRAATWMGMSNPDGTVNDTVIETYSKIKAGLIFSGFQYVSPQGKSLPGQLSNSKPEDFQGLKRLADTIHSTGSVAGAQLVHCGRAANPAFWGGEVVFGPSDGEMPNATGGKNIVKAMTIKQIDSVTKAYADAAERAVKAGFDVINVHGAHGYQLWQFFDPGVNKRPKDDPYTGLTLEGRSKAMIDAILEIKKVVDVPICVKVNSSSSDTKPEEVGELIKNISDAGACLVIISGDKATQNHKIVGEAYFLEEAIKIKEVVGDTNTFFALVGGIRSPETIVKLLTGNENKKAMFDAVALSRPLISEPDLVDRWNFEAKTGIQTPARCISCTRCFEPVYSGKPIQCMSFKDE